MQPTNTRFDVPAGMWGGITSMPSFAAHFFQQHSSTGVAADTPPPSSSYCIYSDQVLSLTGSVIYLAALPAVAAAAHATRRYGRKPTMWGIVMLLVGGTVAGAAANSLAVVFISRCLLGMAMGCW